MDETDKGNGMTGELPDDVQRRTTRRRATSSGSDAVHATLLRQFLEGRDAAHDGAACGVDTGGWDHCRPRARQA
jgi:hypothetical protein